MSATMIDLLTAWPAVAAFLNDSNVMGFLAFAIAARKWFK